MFQDQTGTLEGPMDINSTDVTSTCSSSPSSVKERVEVADFVLEEVEVGELLQTSLEDVMSLVEEQGMHATSHPPLPSTAQVPTKLTAPKSHGEAAGMVVAMTVGEVMAGRRREVERIIDLVVMKDTRRSCDRPTSLAPLPSLVKGVLKKPRGRPRGTVRKIPVQVLERKTPVAPPSLGGEVAGRAARRGRGALLRAALEEQGAPDLLSWLRATRVCRASGTSTAIKRRKWHGWELSAPSTPASCVTGARAPWLGRGTSA